MVSALALTTLVLSSLALVRADAPAPSEPGPGDVFKTGGACTIQWSADTTGLWKNMAIQLMSGDNWNMVPITTVTTLDATSQTTFSWTCPSVTLNAPIYFYQFSAAGQNLTWTTRWTIAGADGSTVAAPNQTQPDGTTVPWGVGGLTDPSTAVAPPSWLAATEGTGSGSGSAVAPASVAASTAPVSSAVAGASTTPAATSNAVPASTAAGQSAAQSTARASGSASASASGSAVSGQTNTTSAALARADMAGVVVRCGTALAGIAAVFAVAL